MSATTQVTDFSDLFTDLLNRIRAETTIAATKDQGKRYINIALQDMHIGFREGLSWAERSADLITHPEYTTGTATINQGSTSLSGTSTLWDTNNNWSEKNMRVGGKIVIDGGVEVYEIQAVASDTAATLTSAFVQANVSAAGYVYFEDEYALDADFLRPVSFTSFDINDEIELIGRNEFRFRFPRNKTTGKPNIAAIVDLDFSGNTTPVRKVRFWKPPDAAYLIRYPFITNKLAVSSSGTAQTNLTDDADEPIVPLQYRHAIVFHALYHWYRDKKDDSRSQEAKSEYTDIMLRIVSDTEVGSPRPQFRPQVSHYARSAKRPYSGAGGRRYDASGKFDQML